MKPMSSMNRALAVAATLLIAPASFAQAAHPAATAKANAAAPKTDDKNAKSEKKDEQNAAKTVAVDPAAKEAERAARRTAQRDAEREELRSSWHGPMTDTLKLELQQHARRIAKLERIKALAVDAKDNDSIARVTKLLEKENARHQKVLSAPQTSEANGKTEPKGDKQ